MSRQLGHIRRKRNIAHRQHRHHVNRINALHALVKDLKRPIEIPGGTSNLNPYLERQFVRDL